MIMEDPVARYNQWIEEISLDIDRDRLTRAEREDDVTRRSRLKLFSEPRRKSELSLNHIDQQEESLLCRLPSEIRFQIYKSVLGNNCFHIVRHGKRLTHRLCQARNGASHYGSACWGVCTEYSSTPFWYADTGNDVRTTDGPFLPFLLSCKLIYSEAIAILYRHNIFAIHHCHYAFSWFRAIVPLQHMVEIRHLHLEVTAYGHKSESSENQLASWRKTILRGKTDPHPTAVEALNKFWASIELMSGLTTLEIRVVRLPSFWLFWLAKIQQQSKSIQRETIDDGTIKYATIQEQPRACKRLKQFSIVMPQIYQVPLETNDTFRVEFQSEAQMCSAYFDSEK